MLSSLGHPRRLQLPPRPPVEFRGHERQPADARGREDDPVGRVTQVFSARLPPRADIDTRGNVLCDSRSG